jgi:hypothetical protein
MSDATIFVTIAFVAVWMKRKNRWKLFFQALEGKVVLGSSPASGLSTGSIGANTAVTQPTTTQGAVPNVSNNAGNPLNSTTGEVAQ